MTLVPYDPTRTSLYTPGLATDFFQLGPMRNEEDTPARNDARLCAEMARLAYVEEEDRLVEYLGRVRYQLVARFDEDGTQAFVARNAETVVVSLSRVEGGDPTDFFSDADFLQETWPSNGGPGRVHRGFKQALVPHWSLIGGLVPTAPKRMLFTGHGLGAALATLAASLRRPDYLATFGSPRVGDATFARRLDGVPHDRFVGCCDLVTRVAPESFGYLHCGRLRYIDRGGAIHFSPSDTEVELDRRTASLEYLPVALRKGTVAAREMADHAPVNYVTSVLGVRSA